MTVLSCRNLKNPVPNKFLCRNLESSRGDNYLDVSPEPHDSNNNTMLGLETQIFFRPISNSILYEKSKTISKTNSGLGSVRIGGIEQFQAA